MATALTVILFLVGVALIIKGGDFFVDAASWMAEASGIPKFIIGATIVSMATTLPEILVSLVAAVEGKVDMAIGNAVGSVTANIGLIMGISLVFMSKKSNERINFAFKASLMTAACAILLIFARDGEFGIMPSIALFLIFAAFIVENVVTAKNSMGAPENPVVAKDRKTVLTNIVKFVLGTAGIVVGAELLVDNGSELARIMRVPESVIGATIIAVGTSLPEFITALTALRKKQASLSMGNIIGANIIDLALILPACTAISGKALPVSAQAAGLDIPACFVVILITVVPALIFGRFSRFQGYIMLAAYAAYIGTICFGII